MSPYPQPPPPAAQPPIQIPYSDPFHNRDPFLPGAQHRREKSYGGLPSAPLAPPYGGGPERAWQGQQAYPQHMQHPVHHQFDHRSESSNYESARRRSIGAAASPPRYAAGSVETFHPPPPAFGPRGMLPPSPSPSSAASFPSQHPSRAPVSTSPFGTRDNGPHRQNGPLSIGSLMGPERAPSDERAKPTHSHNSPTFPPMSSTAPQFRPYQSSPTVGHNQHATSESALQRPNSQPNTSQRQTYSEPWRPPMNDAHGPPRFREYPPQRPEEMHQQYNGDAPRRSLEHTSAPQTHYQQSYYPHQHEEPRQEHEDRRALDNRYAQGPTSSPAPQDGPAAESRFRHYGAPVADRDRDAARVGMRRDDDGHPIPRSLLTVSPELNRREGRSSPLPQAVQGAQPRWIGPARDSSIKNEFGRMFSGLGSGVGGAGTPTGHFSARGDLTPSRMSPARYPDGPHPAEQDGPTEGAGTSLLHKGDRNSAPPRSDPDSANGRNTPLDQLSSNKRMKVAHVPHHHHHHAHAHHHHHHHHPSPDEPGNPRSGFSTIRFPPNAPQQGQTPTPLHHHHHHIVPTHHHHHVPKTVPSPVIQQVTVLNQEVMSQAAQSLRGHLGSALYQASISLPPGKRVLVDTRLMFASTATSIPLFEGKENCTFTIRVPREYVSSDHQKVDDQIAGGLEEICKRRALWGSDIYTDDSDVVAAAVHSGWIKGDFGELNEDIENLFGGNKDDTTEPDAVLMSITTKPTRPVSIPANRDMHITILILPPLGNYAASTKHYLRSRAWGGDHDGMSFMIHRVDFVDEPRATRFMDRGSKGLKDRLKDEQRRRREAAESLLGLGIGSAPATAVV